MFISCRSKVTEEEFPEEDVDRTVEVEMQPPYALNQSLLSSEGSEDDEPEEATDLSASPYHPKPLGVSGEAYGCTEQPLDGTGICIISPGVFINVSLLCSFALLDAVHWVAASSPLTDACITCGLPSTPCWSTMSAHTCGSEYHHVTQSRFGACFVSSKVKKGAAQ